MPVIRLSEIQIWFPPTKLAEEDGLLAYGGDLSTERLLLAYRHGIFPWYDPDEVILWWCPRERFVIFPNEIRISKSMAKVMRKNAFEVYVNRNFRQTMHECRTLRECGEGGTWIGDDMEDAYNRLHAIGHAVSVECYQGGDMVGGLYGVSLGRCFFGESMFSKRANASKVALIHLAKWLEEKGFLFIDCQFHTDHLESMGGRYIPWKTYEGLLRLGIPD